MPSQAQMETESIAWINISGMLACIPLLGTYTYMTLTAVGIESVQDFLLTDPRGQQVVEILIKFAVLLVVWIPMSIVLKIAASNRNHTMLKTWSIFQLTFIFIVALHLLIRPPTTIIMVLVYIVVFIYLFTSFWICDRLIFDITQGSKIRNQRSHGNSDHSAQIDVNPVSLIINSNGDNPRSDSYENVANDYLSLQMKKVTTQV